VGGEPSAGGRGQGPVIEIEFQSLGPHGGPRHEELHSMLSGGSPGDPSDLGALFGQLLAGPPQRAPRRQRPGLRSPLLSSGSFSLDTSGGFGGLPSDHVGSFTIQHSSRVPLSVFNDLFPMPMVISGDDDALNQDDDDLFGPPDLLVANMMQHLSDSFKKDMLPAIQRSSASAGAGAGHRAHEACAHEMKTFCSNTTQSRLQCLGQHVEETSEECRKDVGKSVPFLCSSSIDQLCNVLERGILPCLADHLPQLETDCREAVVATHAVIAKANTQRSSVRNPETGDEKVFVPVPAPIVEVKAKESNMGLMEISDASPEALKQVSFAQKFEPRDATTASGRTPFMTPFDVAAVSVALFVIGFFAKISYFDRQGKPVGGGSLLELGGSEDGRHML